MRYFANGSSGLRLVDGQILQPTAAQPKNTPRRPLLDGLTCQRNGSNRCGLCALRPPVSARRRRSHARTYLRASGRLIDRGTERRRLARPEPAPLQANAGVLKGTAILRSCELNRGEHRLYEPDESVHLRRQIIECSVVDRFEPISDSRVIQFNKSRTINDCVLGGFFVAYGQFSVTSRFYTLMVTLGQSQHTSAGVQ
jgi:hypothetical protein